MDARLRFSSSTRLVVVAHSSAQLAIPPRGPSFQYLFPREYLLQYTEEFAKAFCQDPVALPPASVQTDFWRALEAEPLYEQRMAEAVVEADRRYAHDLKTYERECNRFEQVSGPVVRENAAITEDNIKRRADYDAAAKSHLEASANYERRYGHKAFMRFRSRLRKRIERTIQNQAPCVEAALERSVRIARAQTYGGRCMLQWIRALVAYALLTLMFPIISGIPALIAYRLWKRLLWQYPRTLNAQLEKFFKNHFHTYHPRHYEREVDCTYTPILFFPHYDCSESNPFDTFELATKFRFSHMSSALFLILLCIPYVSVGVVLLMLVIFSKSVRLDNCPLRLKTAVERRRGWLLTRFDSEYEDPAVYEAFSFRPLRMAEEPRPFAEIPLKSLPFSRPKPPVRLVNVPRPIEPPRFDDGIEEQFANTLRGAVVHRVEHVARLARSRVFANGTVRPYSPFGGLPALLNDDQSPHVVCVGTSGSGKTTFMRLLMSALLPLPVGRAECIARNPDGRRRLPASSHEWSRSFTYQAVVYNSKDENIPFLAALGFDPDVDLIILDPADERCFAWDVSRDISDRDSISQFADLMVPVMTKAEDKKQDNDFWDAMARRLIKAIIVSMRNAALAQGKEPAWTLRDLARAVGTRETLAHVLSYHDTPDEVRAQLLELDSPQASSVYLSATRYIAQFEEVGERWAEAARRGRLISLKDWAKNRPGTVLVLPNTQSNVDVYGPLNRVFFKALTNICLDGEYSFGTDGRALTRYFFIDELGQAGQISDLERLMSEGRSFGVHVILGVHQLSQLRQTYGNHGAETILGLCAYLALLKTGDTTTAEWMSKRVGDTLRAYEKTSFAYGASTGTNSSQSTGRSTTHGRTTTSSRTYGTTIGLTDTSGTGESKPATPFIYAPPGSHTKSQHESHANSYSATVQTTEGESEQFSTTENASSTHGNSQTKSLTQTDSHDLRQEAAAYQSEFLGLPDPSLTGCISGYFISPTFPVWRADVPFHVLAPELEFPEELELTPRTVPWQDQERVSKVKPWTAEDFVRLSMDAPLPGRRPRLSLRNDDGGENLIPHFDF